MPANKKSNGVPKNTVRSALVIAATIATLLGSQTLAFSQNLKDLQSQQAAIVITTTQPTDQMFTTAAATNAVVEVPTQSLQSTEVSTSLPLEPSQTPTATATTTATAKPSATATATKQVTKQAAKVTVATRQPAPSTQSSKR